MPRVALGYSLRTSVDAYKKQIIPQYLFKQTMIVGTELQIILDNIGSLKELMKEKEDKAYLEYFNILKKFEGLITGPGHSLATSLHANKNEAQKDSGNRLQEPMKVLPTIEDSEPINAKRPRLHSTEDTLFHDKPEINREVQNVAKGLLPNAVPTTDNPELASAPSTTSKKSPVSKNLGY